MIFIKIEARTKEIRTISHYFDAFFHMDLFTWILYTVVHIRTDFHKNIKGKLK